jgi:hypothetical protein
MMSGSAPGLPAVCGSRAYAGPARIFGVPLARRSLSEGGVETNFDCALLAQGTI